MGIPTFLSRVSVCFSCLTDIHTAGPKVHVLVCKMGPSDAGGDGSEGKVTVTSQITRFRVCTGPGTKKTVEVDR